MKLESDRRLLASMGLDVEVLASGCCGMAGAFGYEKDKYEVSIAAGERVLLPRVRSESPTTLVLADGFSCRSQIEQETSRRALHLAEVLVLAKRGVGVDPYPERTSSLLRRIAQERSLVRAAVGAVAFFGVAVALGIAALTRRRTAPRRWVRR